MTKAEKFRKASKICWALGAFFTWNFMRTVLAGTIEEPAVLWAVSIGAALGVQYLMTLIESTLIDGILPAPWNIDWRNDARSGILVIAALGCFAVDVFVNLGGVYAVTSKLGVAAGNVKALGISDYIVQVAMFVATFFFAMLFALGSELLDALADQYDGTKPMQEHRKPKVQQQVRVDQARQEQVAANQRAQQHVQVPQQAMITKNMSDDQVLAILSQNRKNK